MHKGVMAAVEVQAIAARIAHETGLPVTTCQISDCEGFIPPTVKAGPAVSCLRAFRTEATGDRRFVAIGVQGEGFYEVVVLTEEGFQVSPADPRQGHKAPTRDHADEWLTEQIIVPLVYKLTGIGAERLDEWVEKCEARLAENIGGEA